MDIKQIQINDTTYNIKDEVAREALRELDGGDVLTDITSTGVLLKNALKADGSIQTNNSYKYFKIPNKGYTHISGKASTYYGYALVNFYSGAEIGASTFISGAVCTQSFTDESYSLDVPDNCAYICVSWVQDNRVSRSTCATTIHTKGLKSDVADVAEVVDFVVDKYTDSNLVKVTDFTIAGCYGANNVTDTKTNTTTYKSTQVYAVEEGQIIRFANWPTVSEFPSIAEEIVLCAYKSDGARISNDARFKVKMLDSCDYATGEYVFVVPKDCTQIAFSAKKDIVDVFLSLQIIVEVEVGLTDKGKSLVHDVVDEYVHTKELLSTADILSGKFMNATGALGTNTGYNVYKIPNDNYSRIKGTASNYTGYLCIGFYSGEPSASTLISGWQLYRAYILQPFDLAVPEGCVFICVNEYKGTGNTECVAIATGDNITKQQEDDSAKYYLKGNSNIVYSASKKLGIIAAGQSNIEGRNSYSDLPSGFVNPNSKVHFCNNTNGTFSDFEITNGGSGNDWGFDAILYDALTNPSYGNQSDIYVMKKAMGGTSIDKSGATDYHWTADYEYLSSPTYSLLRTFEKIIRKGMETQGTNFDIKAFVWHQGEGDSGSVVVADRYYDNLKNMLAYMRGVVGNPRLHFFCGTLSNNNVADQYVSVVNAAYTQLASEDPYLHLVDMSDAQLEDSWHFNYQWSIYFGQKVYDLMIDAGIISGTKINPSEPT